MAKTAPTITSFKEFEKEFNRQERENRDARFDAVGLLTPNLLRKHILTKQDLVLAFGRRGKKVVFSYDDLKKMDAALNKTSKTYRHSEQGIPPLQLISASDRKRIKRANNKGEPGWGIRNAMLYRFRGGMLFFQVTASEVSKHNFHRVKIRLDEWEHNLTRTIQYQSAAKKAVSGRVSIACSCEDFQYTYRYLATVGKFAVAPLEKDFPKIRNPKLKGCCCKHVLKCLSALQSPSVIVRVAQEMKRQAEQAGGYADDKRLDKYLSSDELKTMSRAVKKDIDPTKAKKEWEKVRKQYDIAKDTEKAKAQKAQYRAEKKGKKMQMGKDKLAAQEAMRMSEAKKERAKIAANMRPFMDMMHAAGLKDDMIVKAYATSQGKSESEITEIGREFGVIK